MTLTPAIYIEQATSNEDAVIVHVVPYGYGLRPSVQTIIGTTIKPTVSPPVIPQTTV